MKRVTVFISYSHDSDEHRKRVLEQIANRLRYDDIDANLDQYTEHQPPRSWPAWMVREIKGADYVLLVCTPTYRERFEGDAPEGQGRGAKWEGAIITLQMYSEELTGDEKQKCRFIPIAFCDRNDAPVPTVLSGTSFFNVADPDSYAALVRLLKGIPTAEKPPLGGCAPGRTPAGAGRRRPLVAPVLAWPRSDSAPSCARSWARSVCWALRISPICRWRRSTPSFI